jgi:heat shock protein HslJ
MLLPRLHADDLQYSGRWSGFFVPLEKRMFLSRAFYLCILGSVPACAYQKASLNNTPTTTDAQSAETVKAGSKTLKSTEISSDQATIFSHDKAPLRGLLGDWLIENVDQRGVMDNVQLSLSFNEEGRVSGQLGCNAVTGRYSADKASLNFGILASTRKICGSVALMNQEGLVLRSLQTLNALSWSDNGAAILSGPEGHSIIMRRIAPLSEPGMAHGNISPTPVTYRCANEAIGIAFEAGAAYLTEANGMLVVLNKIDKGGADTSDTFTNGKVTVFRRGGAGGHVSFARGRMAPVECQSTVG